jgi:sugar phosphate isomerase/epimerase
MTDIRSLGYLTLDSGPIETITAAAAAGFRSVGIRITGRRITDPFSNVIGNKQVIREIRQRLDDSGIALSNVSAYHFFPDVTLDHMKRVMDVVAELGARIVVANNYDPDEQAFIDKVGSYCELARPHGIRIAIEFMRYSAVKNMQDTTRIIRAVGSANLGMLIDALHLDRSGGTPADILKLNPELVIFAQICDAKKLVGTPSDAELRHEARTGRLFPGDGSLPLRDFLDALPMGTEIEYEVPRPDLGGLTLEERAKVAFSVFEHFLVSTVTHQPSTTR